MIISWMIRIVEPMLQYIILVYDWNEKYEDIG